MVGSFLFECWPVAVAALQARERRVHCPAKRSTLASHRERRGQRETQAEGNQPAPPDEANSAWRSQPASQRGTAAGHFTPADLTHPLSAVCISLSRAASKQSDDAGSCDSAHAFTACRLLPACLPNHCWLCEPAGSTLFRHLSILISHLKPHHSLATAIFHHAGCPDEETQT